MTKLEMIMELLESTNYPNQTEKVKNMLKNKKGRIEEVYNAFKEDNKGEENRKFYINLLIVW